MSTVDVQELLQVTLPEIQTGDAARLARAVALRWTPRQLCPLLQHPQLDVRRVAALCLGLTGDMSVVRCLARALRDPDDNVNLMAEHGLWSIWFRSGRLPAVKPFHDGVTLLAAKSYEPAARCFQEAVLLDPQFAEAYNQCAIAHFFVSDWPRSIDMGKRAAQLVPVHFGAIAGVGHAYLQMGQLPEALYYYRKALAINPRMTTVQRLAQRLAERRVDTNDFSGQFQFQPTAT